MFVRINNPNNRAIGRSIFTLKGKARFFAAAPENQLTHTGAGGIHSHQRFTLRLEVLVEGLNNQQLASFQRRILHGRDDGADYASELHYSPSSSGDMSTVSITPTIAASTGVSFMF